jgi:formamidopyrimidine-DNA glycosylase
VMMHFGMTGALVADGAVHRHDGVVFILEGAELRYRDMRKLTGLHLACDEREIAGVLADLGPDALVIPAAEFVERLGGRHRQLKPALMDQSVVAGLGNLLVDEIAWRARVHPQRSLTDLDRAALSRLHTRMRWVLRTAAPLGRVPARPSWLTGNREDGARCPRCAIVLKHAKVGDRNTVWCPFCQSAS